MIGNSNVRIESNDNGYTEIKVYNIAAKDLDKAYVLKISDGTNTKTVTYSPLSYAYNKQNDESTGTVAKQLYHYWEMADTFFESVNQ